MVTQNNKVVTVSLFRNTVMAAEPLSRGKLTVLSDVAFEKLFGAVHHGNAALKHISLLCLMSIGLAFARVASSLIAHTGREMSVFRLLPPMLL